MAQPYPRKLKAYIWLLLAPLVFSVQARAEGASDPLRLAPDTSEFLVKIDKPNQIVELVLSFLDHSELKGLSLYDEIYGSTNFKRFTQLVGYFEDQMGQSWQALIDPLAGGGALICGRLSSLMEVSGEDQILLILQGKDEKRVQQFVQIARQVVEEELARNEVKDAIQREEYKGIEIVQIVNQFRYAVLGSAIVGSVSDNEVKAAIDRYLDPSKNNLLQNEDLIHAQKLLPDGTLAWIWVALQKSQATKDVLDAFNGEPIIRVPFGALLDVGTRSPFMTVALSSQSADLGISFHFPRGADGMNEGAKAHVPPHGQAGVLPMLNPEATIYSGSFYLDFKQMWEKRAELFNVRPEQLQQIEEVEKQSGLIFLGTRASQLFGYAGARHRIVLVGPTPSSKDGGAAVVLELRDPERFAKAVEVPLRSLALLLGFQVNLKLIEEMYGDYKIVGYQMPKGVDAELIMMFGVTLPNSTAPCFVRVGNFFVASTSFELARQLIDELKKEAAEPVTSQERASATSRLSFSALSHIARAGRDQQIASTILDQGISEEQATKQFEVLIDLLNRLGFAEGSIRCDHDSYRLEVRLVTPK